MKKDHGVKQAEAEEPDDDVLPEYDFTGGVRGKYAARMAEGSNVVVLDEDVASIFPDSESVNRALRLLIELAHREAGEKVLAEKKEPYATK